MISAYQAPRRLSSGRLFVEFADIQDRGGVEHVGVKQGHDAFQRRYEHGLMPVGQRVEARGERLVQWIGRLGERGLSGRQQVQPDAAPVGFAPFPRHEAARFQLVDQAGDRGMLELGRLSDLAGRDLATFIQDAQDAQLRRRQSRHLGQAPGCQFGHALDAPQRNQGVLGSFAHVRAPSGARSGPSAAFRGSRCASYGRHCSSPLLLSGRRTCSELAVRTARSVL